MAIIEVRLTAEKIVLHNQHTIGRNRDNISVLSEAEVSRKHAIIYWESNHWFLTDFSSNGTKVNNILLHHQTLKLKQDDIIQFSNNKNNVWKLVKSNGPRSFLREVKNQEHIIDLENGLMLPEANPQYTLFRDKKHNWVIDDGLNETMLIGGHKYNIEDKEYIFIENESQIETQHNLDITKNASFHLVLSNDEENIHSQIKVNGLVLDLGNRSYNYLLLYLARKRQKDLKNGLSNEVIGWTYIEEISNDLSKEILREVDEYYINNLIFRLRKKLLELPPCGHLFANIIERKKGMLRFSLSNLKIDKEPMFA